VSGAALAMGAFARVALPGAVCRHLAPPRLPRLGARASHATPRWIVL